ncbi:MAG: hypothetical protein K1W30_17765 [Lachnospiraceae bacterium]
MPAITLVLYYGRKDIPKDTAIAKMKSDNVEKDSALMEQQAEIERLHAEIRMLRQA